MSHRFSTLVLAALVSAAAATAAHAQSAPVDVAGLIDDTPAGDLAPLVAALPNVTDSASAALLRAQIAGDRLDDRAAREALAAWHATHDGDSKHQAVALTIEGNMAFAGGDYAASARALTALLALPQGAMRADDVAPSRQTLSVAQALAAVPIQAVTGGTPGSMPLVRDKIGLLRGTVAVNGVDEAAVFDTGANLSTISATGAKKLGLRLLEGDASVASGGSEHIPTRLAVADRLTIAGVTLSHVVFLVIDDDKLSFPVPGGYSIEAIIGFPVFRALGRIEFDKSGRFTAGGSGSSGSADLRASGNDLFVVARVNDAETPLFVDTGATETVLSSRFAAVHPALIAGLPTSQLHSMGAGNHMLTQTSVTLKPVTLVIGDARVTLPELTLATSAPKREDRLGVIGQDVLRQLDSYAIDFRTMRFEAHKSGD